MQYYTTGQALTAEYHKPVDCNAADHGVEYYEAVIADGITSMTDFENWVIEHRQKAPYYWIP